MKKRRWKKYAAIGVIGSVAVYPLLIVGLLGGTASGGHGCPKRGHSSTTSGTAEVTAQDLGTLQQQTEVARKIAAVLTEFGLDDNKVYGAIGNAQQESSLMEPFVELNFLWNYWKNANSVEEAKEEINKYGTRAEDLFKNGWGTIVSAYPRHNLDEAGYIGGDPDGGHWVGFGIWQWTGYSGVSPYFNWADANNLPRASIDSILAFAVSPENKTYYPRLEKIRDMPTATSPAEGADIWLGHYEFADGRTASSGANEGHQRIQYATDWAVRLGKEKLDTDYAKSILSLANTSTAVGNAQKNKSGCRSGVSMADGGHPYANDYYLTAAFQKYSKAGWLRDVNTGNDWHNGIDLVGDFYNEGLLRARNQNRGIHSVLDGVIVGISPGFGQIFIKSDTGTTGLKDDIVLEYTHLLVDDTYQKWKVGDVVKAGDHIANEGDTGSSGVWHLHFGVLNAAAFASGEDLWRSSNSDPSSYGSTTDSKIIDPGVVLDGIEVGWLDSQSSSYLGDEYIQPTPLQIRVDGTTAEHIKK